MGAPDRRGAGFGNAEMAHLALMHEIAHRADRLLDRHGRIDAVDVIEVDYVGLQPLEAALAGLADIVGTAVREARTAGLAQIAELAGDHVIAAMSFDRAGRSALRCGRRRKRPRSRESRPRARGPADRRYGRDRIGRVVETASSSRSRARPTETSNSPSLRRCISRLLTSPADHQNHSPIVHPRARPGDPRAASRGWPDQVRHDRVRYAWPSRCAQYDRARSLPTRRQHICRDTSNSTKAASTRRSALSGFLQGRAARLGAAAGCMSG